MTLQQILDELDALRDFINAHQVHRLETLKTAVKGLQPVEPELQLEPKTPDAPTPVAIQDASFEPLNFVKKTRAYKRRQKP